MTTHPLVKLTMEQLAHAERTKKEHYTHTGTSGKENKEANCFVVF